VDCVDADGAELRLERGEGSDRRHSVRGRRAAIALSGLLAIATATAVLVSGLNGLVQIVKVAVELAHTRGGNDTTRQGP
jgi:hypothetical protein